MTYLYCWYYSCNHSIDLFIYKKYYSTYNQHFLWY